MGFVHSVILVPLPVIKFLPKRKKLRISRNAIYLKGKSMLITWEIFLLLLYLIAPFPSSGFVLDFLWIKSICKFTYLLFTYINFITNCYTNVCLWQRFVFLKCVISSDFFVTYFYILDI